MPPTPDDAPLSAETSPLSEPERTGVIGPGAQSFDSATCEYAFGATAAPRYRQWEYDLVRPFLGRSVLEVGSGMGHFAEKLAQSGRDRLVLSDTDPRCLELLRENYTRPGIEVVELALPGRVDVGAPVETVVAMNVLEHIEDDAQALRDLADAVTAGGRIILWVPAYMQLYGEFDRKVGHFRRYSPSTIRAVVSDAGLGIAHVRAVNLLGGAAWWIAVRRGRAKTPDPRLVWLYDNVVVPTSRTIEKVVSPPFGQSIFCVAEV